MRCASPRRRRAVRDPALSGHEGAGLPRHADLRCGERPGLRLAVAALTESQRDPCMGLSLRDQLLQAGLISEQQAKQANKQKHQQRRDQAKKPAPVLDEQALAAQRAETEKRERDLAANRALLEKVEER